MALHCNTKSMHVVGNPCSAAAEIQLALRGGDWFRAHAFEFARAKAQIDHCLTRPKHPWTNGQVARMNRILKEATVKGLCCQTHEHFRQHLADFVNAYNFVRRLKTLRDLSPANPSAPSGQNNRIDSNSIQFIYPRDHTASFLASVKHMLLPKRLPGSMPASVCVPRDARRICSLKHLRCKWATERPYGGASIVL